MVAWAGMGRGRRALSFINCLWIGAKRAMRLSIVAINLLALRFIALAIAQTIASWPADLVEGRRRIRVFIVSAAALYGGINAILQIFLSGAGTAEVAQLTANATSARRHRSRDFMP